MGRTIKLEKTVPDVVVELGASKFRLLPITKDVEDDLEPIAEDLDKLSEDEKATTLDRLEKMASQLDVVLRPLDSDDFDDDAPLPSTIVLDAYEQGDTTSGDVMKLCNELVAAGNPT